MHVGNGPKASMFTPLAARLDGFDSGALSRIEGIIWSQQVTNHTLRGQTQQLPAFRLAAMRRVRWHGHIIRLPGKEYHPGL